MIRHIPQADLDAYINGQLAGPRLDFCRTHLDSCAECRAELEDLRNFKSSQAGLSIGGSLRRELDRRKRQKQLKAVATAGSVIVVAAVGWFQFVEPRLHATAVQPTVEAHDTRIVSARPRATPVAAPSAAPVAQPRGAAPVNMQAEATVQPTATRPYATPTAQPAAQPRATPTAQPRANALASAQQPAVQPRTAAMAAGNQAASAPQPAIQSRGMAPAMATTQAIGIARPAAQTASAMAPAANAAAGTQAAGTAQPARQVANTSRAPVVQTASTSRAPVQAAATAGAMVTDAASTTFALLGPFGDEISDDRPEFTWQPLAGATKYAVILVDEGLRPIAHARVKTTSWRPRKPLRRGRTYLWQVTAILHNGTKVIAMGPTSVEARIHIAPPSGKHSDQ